LTAEISGAPIPVIYNANAGRKAVRPGGAVDEARLQEALATAGLSAEVIPTDSEEEATAAVDRAMAAGARLIVAAGGDGTIGLVAQRLLGSETALGILPLGSVMNIPRMLGLPRDLEPAAQALAAQRIATIDVGRANGVVFFETASVGINAAVFRAAQQVEDGDWGSPLKAVAAALRYRPGGMVIRLEDGRVLTTRALMVTISNGAYTGVGMTVAPDARLNDGQFDVRLFRRFSKGELLRHLLSIMLGRRAYSAKVETYRTPAVRIESRHSLPCRADANDLGTTPLECEVLARSLKVVVGPDYSDGRSAV
jgi:YegS/Rv2252/BmrU family lipid kinase